MTLPLLSIDRWQPRIDTFIASSVAYALELAVATVILLVGNWASHRLARMLGRTLTRLRADATFTSLMCNFTKWGVRAVSLVIALGQLGVATTSMLAVLGTAGLAIGLALQGTLQNIAAGLMLLLWRPFRVGDYIEGAGQVSGKVADISLFTTRLTCFDGTMTYIPNSQLWAGPVTNFSENPTRRVCIFVTIGHQGDIEGSLGVLRRIVDTDARVLQLPDAMPWIAVADYTELGVKLNIGAWTKLDDYFQTRADLLRAIKPALEDAGCVLASMPVAVAQKMP
jgi:small conductance mechanosensitive channel